MLNTGLSVYDIACLKQKGYETSQYIISNIILPKTILDQSNVTSSLLPESTMLTKQCAANRQIAYSRLQSQAKENASIIQVKNKIILHPNHIEFLANGSLIHSNKSAFTSSANGQEIFAFLDAGYQPISFVFGNAVYSFASLQGFAGSFKTLRMQKMHELSQLFNEMRLLPLKRLIEQGKQHKANAILNIEITILPLFNIKEIVMAGSAVNHPALTAFNNDMITSHLNAIEIWHLAKIGFAPIQLLLSSSVYALGFSTAFLNTAKENKHLTKLIQTARLSALEDLKRQAGKINADDIIGVKTFITKLGNGLIEFLVIGTAIKKCSGLNIESSQLPQEAVIQEKPFLFDYTDDVRTGNLLLNSLSRIGLFLLIIFILVFLKWLH